MRECGERYFKDVVPRNGKDNAFQVSQELDHFRFAIRKQSTWSYSRLRIEVTPPRHSRFTSASRNCAFSVHYLDHDYFFELPPGRLLGIRELCVGESFA